MKFWNRKNTKPAPAPEAVATAVIAGMRAFIADLEDGELLAVDAIGPTGEMPFTPGQWAAYPLNPYRLERRDYFGGPSPADLPDNIPAQPAA
ncbi:hypothetical protein [Streptomyces sp. NBC_01353]|uniref:hypothetical protein n=1 Tax=Streptomyces sp. NBC_01353 TaxID=2903835 RepID=UPI002E2FB507|nr:hypothetical protein [Streptomyces sp. NBC_01353]